MAADTIDFDQTLTGEERTLLAGRYRVVRQLGQGGMGSVWLAEDVKLDGFKVAVKMLPSVLVNNRRAYAQVKAEALVSLKLSHPNIVPVRAFEEENGNPFLVIDYVDGQTLDDWLGEKGELTEEETICLLKPVADALDYAHGQGVVHRDVKPGNVMIARDGTPYVLDFGIAREIQETMTRVTGKLSSGTLLYMSPEQLKGAASKPAQDVYSFAAMAYECLTGEPPFVRGQIEYQILEEQPKPLDGTIGIGRAVMAGLAKMPTERPPSCAAVLSPRLAKTRQLGVPKLTWGFRRTVIAIGLVVVLAAGWGVWRHVERWSETRRIELSQRESAEAAGGRARDVVVKLQAVAGDDGFAERLVSVERRCDEAKSLVGRCAYLAAKDLYEEAVSDGEKALEDDRLRADARLHKAQAQVFKKNGLNEGARDDAVRLWASAEAQYADGVRQYAAHDFALATRLFAEAENGYSNALVVAREIRAQRAVEEARRKEAARKDAVTDIRRLADEKMSACRVVDGSDGFAERIEACVTAHDAAAALYDKSEWEAAAASYTNAVAACEKVLALEGSRTTAKAKREKMVSDCQTARADGAETHAKATFDEAVALMKQSVADYTSQRFDAAAKLYEKASARFAAASRQAKDEKARLARIEEEKERVAKARQAELERQQELVRQRQAAEAEKERRRQRIVGYWRTHTTIESHFDEGFTQRFGEVETMDVRQDGTVTCTQCFDGGESKGVSSGRWRWKGDVLEIHYDSGMNKNTVDEFEIRWSGDDCFVRRYADVDKERRNRERRGGSSQKILSFGYDSSGNLNLRLKSETLFDTTLLTTKISPERFERQ